MTMQTTTLPFQVSGAGAPAQPQRSPSAGVQSPEGVDFSATLSRAMAPTAAPMPAPAAAPASRQAAPAKPADKPAAAGPKTPAREPARQHEAAPDAPATAQQAASTGEAADAVQDATAAEAASAAAEAATTPVTDMLAFMASLAQPAPAAPAVAAAPAAGAAGAGADLQLSALQSAFAKLATTDGAAAADPALPAADGDAAGFSLAAGVQPAAQDATDLRTLQQGAQAAVQADGGKAQPQARDAAGAAAVEAPLPAVTQLQAQAAKLEAAPAPAAVPGDRIPARVGTQAWDNQVSQRIVYMVGKEQAATLTLNPPDLGPVQVVLSVSNDGASVAFSSNQQEVRQALENALPRLREMMSENGIALGNATVDAGVSDQRQAQQDGERRNHGASGSGNAAGGAAANEDNTARPATRTVVLGDNGLVDTFA
ncbi:flagellar hook-length control protein FliK [Massilia sp. X63]|uniref:flagellar hook-length control protein FliK n=1 Tax=Massilia sp. X63 TaxID=3237285 RepID=UPI0034DD8ED7